MDKIGKIIDISVGILALYLVVICAVLGNVPAALGWGTVLILSFRVLYL